MPELPEVETIRRDLENQILNKEIITLKIFENKIIKSDLKAFTKILKGKSFFEIDRIGKLLIFKISDKKNFLLIHLKMTGQLVYMGAGNIVAGGHALKEGTMIDKVGGKLPNKYTRLAIGFLDNGFLYFNDLRKFGYAKIVDAEELFSIKEKFGIEPITSNFSFVNFLQAIKGKKKSIKAVLLDQQVISGLGNIYVDEVLFLAGVRPDRKAITLKKNELENIYENTEKLLKKAIKYRGTTFSDYIDTKGNKGNFSQFLQVYGKKGEQCVVCGAKIEKIKEAGRGTHFCPKCQS